ncbi:hypothetical protein FACS1894217_10490 [Clostridia bacterium]|nr:hypothetical protein FACS1894217_10490 [Clostridia bacterium]
MKKTLIIVALGVFLLGVVGVAIAVSGGDGEKRPLWLDPDADLAAIREWEREEQKYKEQLANGEVTPSYVPSSYPERDYEMDKHREELRKVEEAKDAEDLKAYDIIKPLYNKETAGLIVDQEENYKVMWLMCDMLETGSLNEQDTEILTNYLDRRYWWELGDKELRTRIRQFINWDIFGDGSFFDGPFGPVYN